jgi:hypothetical protein
MLSRKPLRGLANRFQTVNECIIRLYRQLDRDVIRFANAERLATVAFRYRAWIVQI